MKKLRMHNFLRSRRMAEIPSRRRHKLALIDSIAADIARAWDGRNALPVATQFGLPARCVYTAILMLDAELTWLISLQQACVELSPTQTARLAELLNLFPGACLPHQDRAFGIAAQTPAVGEGLQCLCRAQPGGTSQSTAQGPQL